MSREKLGNPNIDWKSVAFGFKKYRRKTIGWGKYDKREREYEDEIYIREVSIIEGGIGCALWDASIIMTRFFYSILEVFKDKLILELGAGCGLPSICLARTCEKIYITDYMESLLDNLKYNLFINSNYDEEDLNDSRNDVEKLLRKKKIKETSVIRNLNWYDIKDQKERMYESLDNIIKKFDFIFGSELTYTLNKKTVDCLVLTIEEFLSDSNGVFMEILSTDRDGVSYFVEATKEKFDMIVVNVNEIFKYGIKKITAQKEENYKFYLLKKKSDDDNNINIFFEILKQKLIEQQPSKKEKEKKIEEENEGEEES